MLGVNLDMTKNWPSRFVNFDGLTSIFGDLDKRSLQFLPPNTVLNGAYQTRDLDLLQSVITNTTTPQSHDLMFEIFDLTWAEGLQLLLKQFQDRVYLPSIIDVKLDSASKQVLRQHLVTLKENGQLEINRVNTAYAAYLDIDPDTTYGDAHEWAIGYLMRQAEIGNHDYHLLEQTLAARDVNLLNLYGMILAANLPLPSSFAPISTIWLKACLAAIEPESLHEAAAANIYQAMVDISIFTFDNISIDFVRRCQEMQQLILKLFPTSDVVRDHYLVQIELYLDQECRNTDLVAPEYLYTRFVNMCRCANAKQIKQFLQRYPRLYSENVGFKEFTSQVLYHPMETVTLLQRIDVVLVHFNTELWLQGRLGPICQDYFHQHPGVDCPLLVTTLIY